MMVDKPWGVSAYGAADVKAMPDLVRARFKVSRTEQTPSDAFAVASEAVRAVRAAVRQHGVPDAAVERSLLNLRSAYSYGSEREFVGYQCEASFSVEFDVSGKAELRARARREAVAALGFSINRE